MAETDGLFPVDTIAALLKVTPRRLQQLANDGWFEVPTRGRYRLVETVQGYIRYLKEGSKESNRGSEQARLARAQAVKVEMENFKRMGELITREQADETMRGLVILLKSTHEGMPGRLSNEFAGLSDAREVYLRLQAELRTILNLCGDYLEKRAASLEAMPEPGIDRPPERAQDTERMGEPEPDDAG